MQSDVITNEPTRLAALHRLELLDTPPEERFDRVTRLVSKALATPMAAVSLIDAERQWFKSRIGIDVAETPRDIAFCGHAVASDAPLVVPDASQDPRFVDNELVTGDMHLRFYAGIPVHSADGEPVGTLCVIDRESRELDAEGLAILADAAAIIEAEINRMALGAALGEAADSQEGLREILRGLPTAVFVVDERRCVNVSNEAARLLTAGLIDDEPFLDCIMDEDRARARSVLDGEGAANVRFIGVSPRRSAVRLSAQPIRNGLTIVTAERMSAH